MKTPEDEAFDELARKQGSWGGGYQAKRQMAANKMQEPAQEPVIESWREFASDYERGFIDGMQKQAQSSVDKAVNQMAQPAQEPVAWMTINDYGEEDDIHYENPEGHLLEGWTYKPLYTHPPIVQPQPVSLRRGDILRCIETDELCTVWATSTTGKTLIKWGANNFGSYTAEQIGELFWLEPKPAQEPVARVSGTYGGRFVYDPINPAAILPVGMAFYARPQRPWVGLTDEEIKEIIGTWGDTPVKGYTRKLFDQIEAKLKDKNNG